MLHTGKAGKVLEFSPGTPGMNFSRGYGGTGAACGEVLESTKLQTGQENAPRRGPSRDERSERIELLLS